MAKKKKKRFTPQPPEPKPMKITPLDDRVVVRFEAQDTTSPGGIILPAASQEKSQFAIVTAVGPGRVWTEGGPGFDDMDEPLEAPEPGHRSVPRVPMAVREGNRVLISRYAGVEFEHGDQQYTILREADILAVCSHGG